MEDPLAIAHVELQRAQQVGLALSERLYAISRLARVIDQCFVNGPLDPPAVGAAPGVTSANALAALVQEAGQIVRRQILPVLRQNAIYLMPVEQLGEQQHEWLFNYFSRRIYPLLTPQAVDPGHPFPYISSDSLNLLVLLRRPGKASTRTLYARLKVPRQATPRLIEVPPLAKVDSPVLHHDDHVRYWVWSEDVVRFFVHELFAGMSVIGIYQFRVLRAQGHPSSADPVQEPVRDKSAPVVRVDLQQETPTTVVDWLAARLEIPHHGLFPCTTPLGLSSWADVARRLENIHPTISLASSASKVQSL
jgi:polyphosphate kinase